MNKTKRTPLQIRAENVSTADEFLDELKARVKVGGLTRPNPVIANLQRRPAFKHLRGHVVGLSRLPKLLKSTWRLAGCAAAVCYGTTRRSDNIDILIDGTGDSYRHTEMALAKDGWVPTFVDEIRTKHHPSFVVRSWWKSSDDPPPHGTFCRRLNLIVPVSQKQCAIIDPVAPLSPVSKHWKMMQLESLLAMKASIARPRDIADMIEIVQGGAPIQWSRIRQLMFHTDIGGESVLAKIQSIAEAIK